MNVLPILLGFGLGFTMAWGRIGFTGAIRALLLGEDKTPLLPIFVFVAAGIVLHAILFGWLGFDGAFVAPAGTATVAGALLFGIGMQLANACGSGTLVALGAGSRRMLAVLPGFVAGSFVGTLHSEFWDEMPAFEPISLGDFLGWPLAAAAQLALLGLIWVVSGESLRVERRAVVAALVLACLAALAVPLVGHPWGITWGFALAGAKIAAALGWVPSVPGFWTQDGVLDTLAAPLLADTTVLMDIGLVAGAFAAACGAARFGKFNAPGLREIAAAVIGGIAMGYGARISGGCNIGAFVGGIVSGSPHGWLWMVGCLAGFRLSLALSIGISRLSQRQWLWIRRFVVRDE